MNSVVDRIVERDPKLSVIEEGNYKTFYQSDIVGMWGNNPHTLFIEEGMFFYGIVRLLKPNRILETGTNLGLSTRFMCLALEDNEKGHLVTMEHDRSVHGIVSEKLSLYSRVTALCTDSTQYSTEDKFEFMFLDTEFNIRFREVERFYPNLTLGGIMCVHDVLDMDCKRFGGPPDVLDEMSVFHLISPHGMLMFQKEKDWSEYG